ncbi:MAG: response regulator [Ignavibacteriales bacterium]|nr:response regulator [Ignavibacteriales bacterium]
MEKILVVEDEESVRENLVELLTLENYECIEASDGLDALKKIKNNLPDLVISDILMPNLNGYEFYKLINSIESEKYIPFIFLTARVDEESINYANELGADDYITKPFKSEILVQRIKTRFSKKKQIEDKFEKLKTNISLYIPHQLRTPLIAILGYSELLSNEFANFTDTEKLEMINSIHNSGLRFQNRVEKFINYTEFKLGTSPKSAKNSINTTEINCLYKLEKCFECRNRINDIHFNLETAELNITLHDFEILIRELIENACKHSPKDSKINVIGKSINNNYQICISNIGDSILCENFNEYSFINDNYNQEGNGLGLSIVHMISEKYNISFEIKNDKDINAILIFN